MKHGLTFCWSKNFEAFGLDLGRKALIAHDTLYCNKSFSKLFPTKETFVVAARGKGEWS